MTPSNASPNFSPEPEAVASNAVLETRKTLSPRSKKTGPAFLPELVALVTSGVILIAVIFAYVAGLRPAREDLKRRQQTRDQMEKQLSELQASSTKFHARESSVAEIVSSVDRFEESFLPVAAQGNSVLYARVNQLIRANNLRNTSGPEYAAIAAVGAEKNERGGDARSSSGRSNNQESLFPGTLVSLTVEGSYANLRHFISDLENTRQFLVINSIEIESNGEKTAGSQAQSPVPQKKMPAFPNNPNNPMSGAEFQNNPNNLPNGAKVNPNRINPRLENKIPGDAQNLPPAVSKNQGGAVISLRLEMAAYFRRANVLPLVEAATTTAQN